MGAVPLDFRGAISQRGARPDKNAPLASIGPVWYLFTCSSPTLPMPAARRDVPTPTDPFLKYRGSVLMVELLSDKWTIPVLHSLARGTRRTGELKRELASVSQKMLTQTLRRLELHGLVTRTVHPVVPPHVDYALTAMGESINEPLAHICQWVEQHGRELETTLARRRRARGA